jgi:ABC-2 type transport system ATP-binding protein
MAIAEIAPQITLPAGNRAVAAPAISIRRLTKRYGPLTALNELNLDVLPGEVVGFLGLNGAGKTTAIRLLLDLLRPTSGTAAIFGHNCWSDGLAARAQIGYLPGELGDVRKAFQEAAVDDLGGRKETK